MKTILGALAAVMLLGAATATSAQAACWGTPWGMRCSSNHYWHHPHWGYGYHHGYYRGW